MTATLLLLVTYVSLVLLLARNGSITELLTALAKSHVIAFTFVVVATEGLSIFDSIYFSSILCAWSLFFLFCSSVVFYTKRWRKIFFLQAPLKVSAISAFVIGIILFILVTTLATGLLYPPNNWDSMTYHMARVANWINNHNITFYTTEIGRQNYQLPLAEFAVMHLQILSGSDLFANLIQWLCFFVSIGLGALLASELGLNRAGQLMSAVLVATIPMAILQSSSTQNDLVVSSFIQSFALFMLRLRRKFTAENIIFVALSLGLALLTKGTAYIYCAALGICLSIPILYSSLTYRSVIRRTGCFLLVIFIALVLSSGHYWRSYRLYGSPLSGGEENYWNRDLSPYSLLSNIPRNIALHLGTPSKLVNDYIYHAVHLITGKQLNNPDTTWPGTSFRINFSLHEDTAGNPIHLLLALLSLALFVAIGRSQQLHTRCYVVGVFLAGILYCVCLKWQPWASRLHTPVFALSVPFIVVALTAVGMRKYLTFTVIASVVFYSLPFVLLNSSRPLLSQEWRNRNRMELYFKNRPDLYLSYFRAIEFVKGTDVQDIGLYLGGDDWEYPFWVLADKRPGTSGIHFRHVGVTNQSKVLVAGSLLPKYIIETRSSGSWKDRKKYSVVAGDKNIRILEKE